MPKGFFTKSNKPCAEAPINTYLFSNLALSNFPSKTELAEIYCLFKDFLYLIQIIPFGSEEILYGLELILLIPTSFNSMNRFFFFSPTLIISRPIVGYNLLLKRTINGSDLIIPSV